MMLFSETNNCDAIDRLSKVTAMRGRGNLTQDEEEGEKRAGGGRGEEEEEER